MAHRFIFHLVGKKSPFSVTPEELENFVLNQFALNRKSCSLAESIPENDKLFTITFDDACKSVITDAFLVLEKLGVKASVFAPTAFIQTTPDFMTWSDLAFLQENGWTIGAHSVSHNRLSWKLYDEDEAAYVKRLEYEFWNSKKTLESHLGIAIDFFAYPFGEVNDVLKTVAKKCGYSAAFSVGNSSEGRRDEFDISRQDPMIDNTEVPEENIKGISVILPAHNRKEMLKEVLYRLKDQSFPEDKYEIIVVDDHSTENIEACVLDAGPNFRYVKLPETGKQFNASAARQFGAELATHPILAFIDSDIAVNKSFLWGIQWVHHNFDHTICLGYLSGYNLDDQDYFHRLENISGKDSETINIIPDRSREPDLRSCIDNIQNLEEPWRLCYTGNFSIPKTDFLKVGGFDLRFNGWGLEDLEFGFRCKEHELTWMFSRFVIGFHMTAFDEGTPRNPFKIKNPKKEDFQSYITNLDRLKELHTGQPIIEQFYHQSLQDIENILHADKTVGIEFGGKCSQNCSFHHQINTCKAGEITLEELKDRVLFAEKINADSLYLLGGEACEHRHFHEFVRFASAKRYQITIESNGVKFSSDEFCRQTFDAGVSSVVLKIFSFTEATYIRMTETNQENYRNFIRGFENLKSAGKITAVKLIVNQDNLEEVESTLSRLAWLNKSSIEIKLIGSLSNTHSKAIKALKESCKESPIVELN